ncbi:MAG: alpha/beta hydrolase, partial [Firmicutes bacterium]|nr:alpha/beta hydrolase [Bacillota bacterium]
RDDRFTGEAPELLPILTDEIVPQVERLLDAPPAWRCLAGYSMAGLFAVWAAHRTDLFTRILSASGSMWYPGWLEYVREHAFARPVEGVYLSVGEQESTSRNAVLQTVGERTRAVATLLAERGVNTKFELNPGNHFKEPDLRMAKGFAWLLAGSQKRSE